MYDHCHKFNLRFKLFTMHSFTKIQFVIQPAKLSKLRFNKLPKHDSNYYQIMVQSTTKLFFKQNTKRWRKVLPSHRYTYACTIF